MFLKKNKHTETDNKVFFSERPFGLTIGPQRSGTTWINDYLFNRGDVCLPHHVKETFYFDKNYHKGLDYYRHHFDPKPEHKMMIEISATAFHDPEAPKRVHNLFGNEVKLLCPLRHPVLRSYSLYRHFLQYGLVEGRLDEAIDQRKDIVTSSLYSKHLKSWVDVFGQENIPVVFLEDLRDDSAGFTEKVCDAFGLKFQDLKQEMRNNKQNYAVKPPHPALARFGQNTADFLRDIHAYQLISLAKRAGLKRVFFGTGKREEYVHLTGPEHDLLLHYLSNEVKNLEALLGYKIPLWDEHLFFT